MPGVRLRYTTIVVGDIDINSSFKTKMTQPKSWESLLRPGPYPVRSGLRERVLAHLMRKYNVDDKRILELGCGIALGSLVLNQRFADITASAHHPETEKYLRYNASLNNGKTIPVRPEGAGQTGKVGISLPLFGSGCSCCRSG